MFWFQPDTPADIRPHPVPTGFQKFESGTFLNYIHFKVIHMVYGEVFKALGYCVTKSLLCFSHILCIKSLIDHCFRSDR